MQVHLLAPPSIGSLVEVDVDNLAGEAGKLLPLRAEYNTEQDALSISVSYVPIFCLLKFLLM